MHSVRHTRTGFSLVELSIVLVILGLLVGGVLAGQALIHAAELRAVSTEYSRYVTATQSFRDKYMALPGDMTNATRFWGDQATGTGSCADAAVSDGTPGTCNGNGDGRVSYGSEIHRFWQQLAMAGLIEGTYSGVAGPSGAAHCVIGTQCPRSKLNNAGWGTDSVGQYAGDAGYFAGSYNNFFSFGAQTTEYPYGAVLKPEEAWNIDTKLDDGRPGLGRVFAVYYPTCTNAASRTDTTTTYKLDSNTIVCGLAFANAY